MIKLLNAPLSALIRNSTHYSLLKSKGIEENHIMNMAIDSLEKVHQLNDVLRKKFPFFLTNVLKILLFKEEEKLACILTAFY